MHLSVLNIHSASFNSSLTNNHFSQTLRFSVTCTTDLFFVLLPVHIIYFYAESKCPSNWEDRVICVLYVVISWAGIATQCGLDGPGVESWWWWWWGARFSTPIQTSPGVHPASYTMGTRYFLGVKWPGSGFDHPSPSSAEVKERVQIYLYSTSGPLWPFIGWTFCVVIACSA